jgi:predicted transcriptional regulator
LADISLLTIIGFLLAVTVGAAIQYYRIIRKAQSEYDKARELVEDVVTSFNRELRRETGKIDSIDYKTEGNASKLDTVIKRIDTAEKRISPIDAQLNAVLGENQRVTTGLTETNTKMRDLEESQMTLKTEIVDLREQVQRLSVAPELKIEQVIPIKRDKAMASLTETEIAVLEMLAAEGSKTAPEIKERVQLSREHTARLMKKLYEEGYLERETGKIPFKYNVKKEMERLLKKPETPQT